jgi:hypothetical protein
MLTGKLYDWLKWTAQIILPACGTLYYALADILNLASAYSVVGVVVTIDFLLGVWLGISQWVYAKQIGQGDLLVNEDEDGAGMRLELDHTPEELATKQEVRFKVKRRTSV